MPFARVYIVRHGETRENRTRVIQGQLDTELNELGEKQAGILAKALSAEVQFDMVYSSDLKRAAKTAEILIEEQQPKEGRKLDIKKEEVLRERFLGALEGTVRASPQQHEKNVAGDATIETTEAFTARAAGWWTRAILQHTLALPERESGEPYNVLVVSHGGWINTLLRGLIGSGEARLAPGVEMGSCRNVSVTILEVERDTKMATMVKYGDIAHLESEEKLEVVETNVDEVVVDAAATYK